MMIIDLAGNNREMIALIRWTMLVVGKFSVSQRTLQILVTRCAYLKKSDKNTV